MRSRRALLCLAAMSALTLSAVAQEAAEKEPAHTTHEGELLASCDVCMPISVPRGPMQVLFQPGFQAGVDHQYTALKDLKQDGQSISNPYGEKIDSNSTQFHFTYNLSPKAGFVVTVPYHNRSYRRSDGAGNVESGTVSGLGDIIVGGRYAPVTKFTENSTFIWTVDAGMKLPTGSTRMLTEDTAHNPTLQSAATGASAEGDSHSDGHDHNAQRGILAHAGHDHSADASGQASSGDASSSHHSPVGGHDLTLGSGSVDGVLGTGIFFRQGDFYATAGGQYVLRSTGAAGYRYGDLITWRVAPGCLFVNNSEQVMGIQVNVSGEHHDPNRVYGARDHGYADTIYAGPEFMAQGENLSLNLGLDLPVKYHGEGMTLAPDYRARVHFNWRF